MKYQGVLELSVREYLGFMDGCDAWRHLKYAVGINLSGEVYDYKTGEKYNFIPRSETGKLQVTKKEVEVGEIYAVQMGRIRINPNQKYSIRKINKYINESELFGTEYKEIKHDKQKILKRF